MSTHDESARTGAPVWAKRWLWAAGIYNLVWGALTIAFPHLLFDFAGVERLNHPAIWQCVGMIVGVYGVGYILAAGDPRRHWPIVLVGLLGKILGPLGFAAALLQGTFPPLFGVTILTNDLVWWVPFGMILFDALLHTPRERPSRAAPLRRFVKETRVDASPSAVFRYHESPDALRDLIPPWEPMRVAESAGSLAVGSRVVLRGRAGPVRIQWVAIHTEYDPPRSFADRQDSGPFLWWYHRHLFVDDGRGGTLLRDEVEYQAPLGRIGDWLGRRMIEKKLERMFEYRHETTRRKVEAGSKAEA
ncbi:MAG: SRPBCC family protein [Planctomycetota bacterium]|nr:SRPBCC family protein [Planctomycetota bacterium]